jgi:hypothetical protein
MNALPVKLTFGNVVATTSSTAKKLTLKNKSLVLAHIGALSPPTSFILSSDTCSHALVGPKKTCTVKVAFAPTTVVGSVSETFVVPYNGISPPEALNGVGIPAQLNAPALVTFSKVAAGSTGTPKKITIKNKSAAIIHLGPASAIANFKIAADGCANASLGHLAKCVVMVEFAPAGGTSGVLTSTLAYAFKYGVNNGGVSIKLQGKVK